MDDHLQQPADQHVGSHNDRRTGFAEPLSYTVFREFVGATDLDLLTRNRWAITIHAAFDSLGGPEEAASGQQVCREVPTYFRDFIGHYITELLYPSGPTRSLQTWLGILVLLSNLLIYGHFLVRKPHRMATRDG